TEVTLLGREMREIAVYSLNGVRVYFQSLVPDPAIIAIPTTLLPSGVYIVSVNGKTTKKLVVD
ncbi:MAG: T9SS type A sorting domain-containing protein, partial [Draconibacterium sp.]